MPDTEFHRVLCVLRAWFDRPDAGFAQFSYEEQQAAARVVQTIRAGFADSIVTSRFDHLQTLAEVGEPRGHLVAYQRGSEQAEKILRG